MTAENAKDVENPLFNSITKSVLQQCFIGAGECSVEFLYVLVIVSLVCVSIR